MTEQPETGTPSSFWLQTPQRLSQDRRLFFALAVGLLLVYLPGLGSYGLYDPWETHYGEVARNMVEHDNYIDPFWGSPWDPADAKREREGFYSKPPLIMWMMSAGMELFGYTELGVRFFFPLTMVLALMAVYLAVSRFYHRRAGLIATAVAACVPFVAMLGRQAVTDGPMVAIVTAGMMALAIGLCGVEEDEQASGTLYWFTLGLFVLVVAGQLWTVLPMDRSPDVLRPYPGEGNVFFAAQWWLGELFTVGRGKGWVLILAMLPIGVWTAWRVARQRRRRMLYIYLFYICCGLTVPAKGWLGWAPMGGAIIGYLVVTGEWKTLAWVDVPTGLLIVFMTGHPWVVAMLGGHHPAWYDRFIIHDHIKRLTAGVHSIDDGGFEYFFRWIGYGLFPFIGLLPAGLARVLGGLRRGATGFTRRQRFDLLMIMWVLVGFFLFAKSSTKFHHYIFPVIPPMAILIALFIDDVLDGRGRNLPVFLVSGAAITLWVGQDLFRMPAAYGQGTQNLVNLFTYKYDREWPRFTGAEALEKLQGDALTEAVADNTWLHGLANGLGWITLLVVVGLLLMAFSRDWKRQYGAAVLGIGGLWCGWWSLHTYLPEVSVHWSQKAMFDAYYADCTKFGPEEDAEYQRFMIQQVSRVPSHPEMFPRERCREPMVAFRTNWRGEAYYSANTVIPTIETKYLEPFMKQWGNDHPFYLFTEKSRVKSELEPNLPAHLKGQYRTVFGQGLKFVLLRVEKGTGEKPPPPEKPEAPAKLDEAG